MTRPAPPPPSDLGLLDIDERPSAEIVLTEGDGNDDGPFPRGTFRRPISGMVTLVAAIIASYIVPPLHFARPWTPEDPVLFWNLFGRGLFADGEEADEASGEQLAQAQALAQTEISKPVPDKVIVAAPAEEARIPDYVPHADDEQAVPRSLDLPHPEVLDSFFSRLTASDLGYAGAVTRAVHWGDSVVANDNVTSTLRELMQARFGDAGHGFHLLARPTASYRHRGVRFSDGEAWSRCYIINDCKSDGHYGLGGTTVWSAGGARSKFATASDGNHGLKASRFELWYAAEPRAGVVRITIDDREPVFVETALPEGEKGIEDRVERFTLEDGPHAIDVRAGGKGKVRLYGVVLERDVPGVVWDEMSQLGAFSSRMLNFDPDHLREQIALRDPALLVFQFGGNDLLLKKSQLERYESQYREMIRRFRGAPPADGEPDGRRACLVVSPLDHGERVAGRIESVEMMGPITDVQRRVAAGEGCAFFDTWAAMGGKHSVARWRKAHPPLISGDLAHLTDAGQRALGRMIYLALVEQYRAYRERVAGQSIATLHLPEGDAAAADRP